MLANADASAASNGTTLNLGNGSAVASSSGTLNGTSKNALAVNGSPNGDKLQSSPSPKTPSYFGHDREEVTRILIQALSDMGYQTAAEIVSNDSGYDLESPTVTAFRSAVLAGSWTEAERMLSGAAISEATKGEGNGLVLAPGSDRNLMRFWLRQQKFLELLEQRQTSKALVVLRSELTPLYQDTPKLHFLSSLLMCRSPDDLKIRANWDGAQGTSRRTLLSELSRCISPSVMLPENRLAILLQHVKQNQINSCLYHTAASAPSLYSDHLCDRRYFPTDVALELSDLEGEVWQVQFSHDGSRLAACGSDESAVIWDTKTFTVLHTLVDHELNVDNKEGIGNISWSPDDSMVITCARDRYARLWDAKTGALLKKLKRFDEPATGCCWTADSTSFVLGTLAISNSLCTFNVHDEEVVEWEKKHRVQDLCKSIDNRWLVALDDSKTLHVYNANTRELDYELELKVRPTSVSISEDCRHLLVNRRDGEAQIIDLTTKAFVQKFLGHTGGDYLIRSSFGGANESFVISGSEDGNILIWHKNSGAAVERLSGHVPRCNAVAWNPTDPCVLASCGDDGRIKIWSNKSRLAEMKLRHAQAIANNNHRNGWGNAGEEI